MQMASWSEILCYYYFPQGFSSKTLEAFASIDLGFNRSVFNTSFIEFHKDEGKNNKASWWEEEENKQRPLIGYNYSLWVAEDGAIYPHNSLPTWSRKQETKTANHYYQA